MHIKGAHYGWIHTTQSPSMTFFCVIGFFFNLINMKTNCKTDDVVYYFMLLIPFAITVEYNIT